MVKTDISKKIYPDTPKGIQQYLENDSIFVFTKDTKYIMDPKVQGVWKVTALLDDLGISCEAMVYLAGYPDAFGYKRDANDFETLVFYKDTQVK